MDHCGAAEEVCDHYGLRAKVSVMHPDTHAPTRATMIACVKIHYSCHLKEMLEGN